VLAELHVIGAISELRGRSVKSCTLPNTPKKRPGTLIWKRFR
jgi:hypothetical protein